MISQETVNAIIKMRDDRDWGKFHTPANLAKSIAIEAGELLECFQWSESDCKPDHIREELADVLIYCTDLLLAMNLDADEIIQAKIRQNEAKYPVEKAKGNNIKYTDF